MADLSMGSTRAGAPIVRHLFVRIDPRSTEPLQVQVYAGIRRAILDGTVARGVRLPSSRALAADLRISRTTTVLAFDQLAAEGYVTTRAGSGTFVTCELPDEHLPPSSTAPGPRVRRHPPLSRRGMKLAATPPTVVRIAGPPRPFRLGTPALDRFPFHVWARLTRRRLQTSTFRQLDYGDAGGLPALREAIAAHVSRARGTSCVADQVIVLAGAQHGLEMISRLVLDPGDIACMEEPGYPGMRGALVAAGARIRAIPVDAQGLNVEIGRRRAPTARVIYVTPSHQFPLGVPMSLPRRLALLAWARQTGAWIIEDDYDSEFRYDARPIPCLHGLDRDSRVIYVGSFSKTLFPALRLGFLIVPLDLHHAVIRARRADDLNTAALPQAVVCDLMSSGYYDRHLRRMRSEYRARLDALGKGVARYCRGALRLRAVTTGLHAVADLHGADANAVCDEAIAHGIEAMPVSAYCARPGRVNALVLGFGSVNPDALYRGTERLAEAIGKARRAR